MEPFVSRAFTRLAPDGRREPATRRIALETPIAIEVNGLGYAVMMASPVDLADFAFGFCHAERLIDTAADIVDIATHAHDRGVILRVTLIPERADRVVDRVRHRVSESSCGLCGLENLEQALRPLPRVTAISSIGEPALFAALAELGANQPINRATNATHAAALLSADGAIRLVREDVGRHNAFDKLIGAMLAGGLDWAGGAALLTARCSFELVEKAVLANCPLLVTISAPTSLALDRAEAAGLRLITLARPDAALEAGAATG
nr:formate dehydrogenase accessory sulfurtransferase FdhD [Sphingomonas laterariae]